MPDTASLYDTDWYAWTQDQAARLRGMPAALRPNGLDVENLAEEVESMGRAQRRELRSLLEQIFIHLLKFEFHPARDARAHCETEISTFRIQAELSLEDSPSLRSRLPEIGEQAWRQAFRYVSWRVAAEAPDLARRMEEAGVAGDVLRYAVEPEALEHGWLPSVAD
jgi:hypothetical protein